MALVPEPRHAGARRGGPHRRVVRHLDRHRRPGAGPRGAGPRPQQLEAQVAARTAELRRALESLRAEVEQREQAEANLRQMQKMEAVGQLTGGIAHDFNNMLQGIAGSLEIAQLRAAEGRTAEVLRYLEPARQALDRAAGLTRRLLAFARRQRLEPKPVDADALVAGMADLVRRTVGPSIRLELHLRDGRARVLCDSAELESALLNLCINARDAMPEGGRLTIGTEDVRFSAADLVGQEGAAPGDYVEISVTDTGNGMPTDVMERVFEPFFTTKPIGQGTGLGLSQVYGFVRQSGGVVRIESALGRGTTVRVRLPQHAQVHMVKEPDTAPVPNEAGPDQTVLLVDDEDVAREAAAERLRELGYRVLEAADGPAALHLLDGGARIDMLVTDVGLPNGMNGRQVAEAVRERRPGIPLLFITGYAGTELPPGSEVIDKPFELDTLARRVQAALARR
ncbi:response regulator [Pseudoroseomonas oryzae]|uniref:histidine kinase n=1 Tax=Teichococcus oryzae TaxID=1608942 RepID=A0A5B2TAL6_9PROT|nr:response regulator [Pseudoroseomonas oryzae]